ncbi:MAG: conjugal transfer protein TraG N-terminal domain-containing protein, partial [Candidatus Omnitrophica bacterium]|nr:conjugal transfer protein TraG N-terminal domain-containing protein [Candidatus Omnitrophota bacterium]
CSEVAPLLVAQFSQATLWESGIRATCAARGFDVQNVASYNACKSLLLSSVNAVYPNTDLANTFRQALFAHAITEVASSDSPAVMSSLLATRQTQSQFIGLGIHANSWIPVLKSSLTTVAVGITPVLLLFVATPLIGRALSLTLGMFVWLSMWGVIDSIIHGFGYDLAQQASAAIKSSPDYVGVQDMFLWPGYTAKVAATFGALRWAGLMLASVITGMLIKFGGTALAMLAGSISGMPQSSGAAYGRAAVEPGGVLSSDILPTMTWSNAAIATGGLSSLTRGLVQKQAGEMAGSSMFGNEIGAERIAQATRGSQLGGFVSGLGTGMAIDSVGVGNAVKAEAVQRAEQYQKGATLYDEYGGLSGAKRRGGISGQMYGDSFTGIEEQRSVYSKASGRNASYGNLSEAVSSGKKVVAYSGDRGYVQLGSGAIVFVDGNNNYALLGMDSPVRSSISEGITYKEAGRAVLSNKVTQRFSDSLMNRWFDSSSGEYREQVGEQFRNTFSQSFIEKVASSESLSKALGFKKNEEAFWRFSAGGKGEVSFSGPNASGYIDFNTGVMTRYDKTTGIETKTQLNSEQLNEIRTTYDYAKQKGWDYVVSSRSGFEYVRSKAKEDSYEVGKAFEQSYEEAKSYGKAVDLNTQNSIFHSYTLAKYGAVTVDTVAKADADFRRMSATGDYSSLWSTINKPFTEADPETVKDKISGIQNMVYNEGGRLTEQGLNTPVGNPNVVNPGVNLDIKEPNYSFVKSKKISVNDLVNKFNKEHMAFNRTKHFRFFMGSK